MQFKALPIGSTFHFASESGVYSEAAGGILQWQGARGPWAKISDRRYIRRGDPETEYRIGHSETEVVPAPPEPFWHLELPEVSILHGAKGAEVMSWRDGNRFVLVRTRRVPFNVSPA